MPTERVLTERGVSYVETVIALGLAALAGVALLATNDYFTKARLTVEARAAHSTMRNLIYQHLSQSVKKCGAGNCLPTPVCGTNLKSAGRTTLNLAKAKLPIPVGATITEADAVELAVETPNPDGTYSLTVASTNPDPKLAPPNAVELRDHLKYQLFLIGQMKAETTDDRTYVGAVVLVGHRNIAGLSGADLRVQIPITFTASRSDGNLLDCSVRANRRPLLGSRHGVDDCIADGGTPIPTEFGDLCRFTGPLSLVPPQMGCPIDFAGNPNSPPNYCYPDPAGEDPLETVPPCKPLTTGRDATNTVVTLATPITPVENVTPHNQGALFCDYQGPTGAADPKIPDCPAGEAVAGDPETAWVPAATPPFDPVTNRLTCMYLNRKSTHPTAWFCDTSPSAGCVVTYPGPPYNPDAITPACSCPIKSCPNGTLTPPPYVQVSAYPNLRCKPNPNAPQLTMAPAPLVLNCPSGYEKVDPDDFPTQNLSRYLDTRHGVSGLSGPVAFALCK